MREQTPDLLTVNLVAVAEGQWVGFLEGDRCRSRTTRERYYYPAVGMSVCRAPLAEGRTSDGTESLTHDFSA